MIKKTLLITLLFILASSCGKKGDPEYKAFNNSNSFIQII